VKAKGAALNATEQPIDTGTAAGKGFLEMLGVFAEFETNLRKERQLEGIPKAKEAGIYKGRPASIDATHVYQMKADGLGPQRSPRRSALVARAYTGCSSRPGKAAVRSASPVTAKSPDPSSRDPSLDADNLGFLLGGEGSPGLHDLLALCEH
jgi:DNA invertase Pin-like site-specific DNA recombinase